MSDRIYRGVIACCALALLGFDVYFGSSGHSGSFNQRAAFSRQLSVE